jgi:hypothetical protein
MRIFTDKRSKRQYAEIPTRAPVKMHLYSKALGFALGISLKQMYKDMATQFLQERPWEYGLSWRPTKGLTQTLSEAIGEKQATGWMQVNIRIPAELATELEHLAIKENVSLSSLSYTLLYWWTWYKYPPVQERRRREEILRKQGEHST